MSLTPATLRPSLAAICAVMLWIAGVPQASAQKVAAPPAGQRVFFTGHSFHMFVPERMGRLAESAGIEGHRLAGRQGIGGSRVHQHWDLKDGDNAARMALEGGEVDVFTMACHIELPDEGITRFTELGLKHNPQLRLLVQLSWMPWDLLADGTRIKNPVERDSTDLELLKASTLAWRKRLEAQVDQLNAAHGRQAVCIVPVGDAVNRLRELAAAGQYGDLRRPSDLFTDLIGHGTRHIQALASYANFAVIYRRSPQGLTLKEPGISDAQHAVLQRLAWEAVKSYPYAGLERQQP